MESLPDDVWHKILQIGIETERLDCMDLCSLAIVNSHFDQLTQDPSLWAILLSRDFPKFFDSLLFEVPSKALYKKKHERNRALESLIEIQIESLQRINRLYDEFSPLHFYFSFTEQFLYYPSRSSMQITPSRSDFSHLETHVNSGTEANSVNDTVRSVQDVLALHEEGDPVLSHANHARLIQGHNRYYEHKSRKRFNKMSRPKVIPNCKSYIPMNRPPRRSMPRKI